MQEGVIAFSKINVSHWEPIVVNSFLLIILRDTSVVFQYKNNGNKFENAIRSAFHNLQGNDSILIFSIRARLANGEIVFLSPLCICKIYITVQDGIYTHNIAMCFTTLKAIAY